jgi:hypothetical protein
MPGKAKQDKAGKGQQALLACISQTGAFCCCLVSSHPLFCSVYRAEQLGVMGFGVTGEFVRFFVGLVCGLVWYGMV